MLSGTSTGYPDTWPDLTPLGTSLNNASKYLAGHTYMPTSAYKSHIEKHARRTSSLLLYKQHLLPSNGKDNSSIYRYYVEITSYTNLSIGGVKTGLVTFQVHAISGTRLLTLLSHHLTTRYYVLCHPQQT